MNKCCDEQDGPCPICGVSPLSAALDARGSAIEHAVQRELSKWDALWRAIVDAAAKAVKR